MATDLIMPRLPGQQHPGLFQPQVQQQPWAPAQQQAVQPIQPIYAAPSRSRHQRQQSSITPQISPLSTSGNGSPTSPKAYHTRQIRPLYMPAVLRPNQFPHKAPRAPPSPPTEDEDEDRLLKSNSSFISLGSALTRLSRRSTGDSAEGPDGSWNLDMYPEPSGLPTRKHWKADHESTMCDHSTCRRQFSYFTRRHHCRRCGNIFCDAHSAHAVPLDQDANYNPRGTPVRACAHCHGQFREWRRARANSHDSSLTTATTTSSSSSSSSASSDAGSTATATAVAADAGAVEIASSPLSTSPDGSVGRAHKARPEVALSVPRDWNWSTF